MLLACLLVLCLVIVDSVEYWTATLDHATSLRIWMSAIDLNDLKQWNDGHGHAKGDDAICTLVHCVQKVIPKACYLYRTGGDEFMILCFNKEKETVEQLLTDIRRELAPTPYSCAIGLAYRDRD
ncbi:MAG: GGDEF domain-containing protein [Agathobacter sp.]